MATTMHRLQISLPDRQFDYLRERAERESASIAEIIRRLVEREAEANSLTQAEIDAALRFAGIIKDEVELMDGKPVSENIDLYLTEALQPKPGRALREKPIHPRRTKKARG